VFISYTPSIHVNILINRIVNLAHYQLIKTTTHLHDQIVWGSLDTHATHILGLIQLHCPPSTIASPFTTAPLQCSLMNATTSSSNTAIVMVNPPKKCKCGLCRVEGHYSKYTINSLIVTNSSFLEKKCPSANASADSSNGIDKENPWHLSGMYEHGYQHLFN
jgi:hypothetical protein